jgi:hypothetical protein
MENNLSQLLGAVRHLLKESPYLSMSGRTRNICYYCGYNTRKDHASWCVWEQLSDAYNEYIGNVSGV